MMEKVLGVLRRGFAIKLGLVAILVILGDWLFWQNQYGIGNLGLYGLVLLGGLIVARPATVRSAAGILACLASALYCVAIFLNGSVLSIGFFWTAITMAALMPFASRFKDGWQWFGRLALHAIVSPFAPILDLARVKKAAKRSGPTTFGIRAAIGLLALPIIGGAIFLALFVRANPVLEKMFASWTLPTPDEMLVVRAICWAVAALAVWSLFRPWRRRGPAGVHVAQQSVALGFPSLASIVLSLMVFNAIFLMQNGMDLAFMSGIVPLPDDMNLAEYAHRGAYPLIATAMLAGLFVLLMLSPGSAAANDKTARLLVCVWIAQNVVLVISSMVRTWDYVEAYSLTQLRIAALAWMVLVGIGLALICWRMLRAKSGGWLINANLLAAGLMLTGFCFIDTRGVVASWNVAHAREVGGRGVELDLCYMSELGAGAIAPLMQLEAKPLSVQFRTRVKAVRQHLMTTEQDWINDGFWTWQLERRMASAKVQQATLPPLEIGTMERNCYGNVRDLSISEYDTGPSLRRGVEPPELTIPVAP
jgi:hypothetical protein